MLASALALWFVKKLTDTTRRYARKRSLTRMSARVQEERVACKIYRLGDKRTKLLNVVGTAEEDSETDHSTSTN